MNGLLDSLKQKKAVMVSPLAFIMAACGGGCDDPAGVELDGPRVGRPHRCWRLHPLLPAGDSRDLGELVDPSRGPTVASFELTRTLFS